MPYPTDEDIIIPGVLYKLKKTFARQLACKGLFISVQTLKNSQLTMKSPGKCRATVSSIGLTAGTEPPTPRICHPAESR